MGWTVLYIAFGVVALWLLGEVLLQYKARLRWRVLAFAGFAVVVVGVLLPSVPVIGAGAIAFAVGQTYVTLSFRRGFATGWAIGGKPGASKRRRGNADASPQQPTLQVSGLEYGERDSGGPSTGFEGVPGYDQGHGAPHQGQAAPHQGRGASPQGQAAPHQGHAAPQHDDPQPPVFEPQPMPDETGRYGIYDTAASFSASAPQPQGHDGFGGGSYPAYDPQGAGAAHDAADTGSAGVYAYDTGQQQYAAYSDPYIGPQSYGGADYDSYGGQQQLYPGPYEGYPGETPPGGVWVPQQRDGEQPFVPEAPQQPAGHPNGHDTGANGQYRY